MILADYLIIACENNIFERTKYMGARLPVLDSKLFMSRVDKPEFRFGDSNLGIGKMILHDSPKEGAKPYNFEMMADSRPVISRNPYSENVMFNFGYGAWQYGLAFWGAAKITEFIEYKDCPDEPLYSSKRFIKL